jgi:dihydrofolate synthase / folylpolyglutamate synthase
MSTLTTMLDAENLIYQSFLRAQPHIQSKKDEKVRKPQHTRHLLDLLGSPDAGQKFVLVTGSKGKGSTSMFLASLLQHHGFKVGLFTSPHLVKFNERIRLNGKPISDHDFIRFSNKIRKDFETIEKNLSPSEYQGPIGIALTIAALYFKENNTDINIIECGRGGKFDDTNVLKNEWAVITSLMEEHITQLGPSIFDIVKHKLGISKEMTKFVTIGKQEPFIKEYISQKLKDFAGNINYYEDDYFAEHIHMGMTGTLFSVKTKRQDYKSIHLPLLGAFQAFNAAAAINTCESILNQPLNEKSIHTCFRTIEWPGRCEILSQNPTVIVDGAINKESALYVKEVIQIFGNKKITSIVGIPQDKDYKGVIHTVSAFSNKLIITKPDISHLSFPADAFPYAKTVHTNVLETEWLAEAITISESDGDTDIILIIGTQTLIGNAKRLYTNKEPSS